MKKVLTMISLLGLMSSAASALDMAALERAMANPDRPPKTKSAMPAARLPRYWILWVSNPG